MEKKSNSPLKEYTLAPSDVASNALSILHEEDYDDRFNDQSLNVTTLITTAGRTLQSVNANWRFTRDLFDTGLRQSWFSIDASPELAQKEPWDYDPFSGPAIDLPCSWNLLEPEMYHFEGSCWFTKELDLQIADDKRLFLYCEGANYDTKVFVNGSFCGNHYGGSTPFCYELTDIRSGMNRIQFCVNNQRTLNRVPMRHCDWFNYGGIHRSVYLIETPRTYIKDFSVYLEPDGTYQRVCINATVVGDADMLHCEIAELGVQEDIRVTNGKASVSIECSPELWSPESPTLYSVELRCKDDCVRDAIGFREISTKGTKLLLNGEPIFLRGISVHEDDVDTGRVLTEDDLQRRFQHVKELGANCMRLAHYPHNERVARYADKEGVLLWEEIPVYWAIDFTSDATRRDASNQLAELIERDKNRASVILWGIGNENADTDERYEFMSALAEEARNRDHTRLIGAACLVDMQQSVIADRLIDCIDVVGINEYYGWYYPNPEELLTLEQNSALEKPLIISEFGAGALAEGPKEGFFSERYMADVYSHQLQVLQEMSVVQGITPWILYDFRAERRRNVYQQGFNRKGLIAEDKKTKKEAFHVLKEWYHMKAKK